MDGAYFQGVLTYYYLKPCVRILGLNLKHHQVNMNNSKCQQSIREEFIKPERGHLARNSGTDTSSKSHLFPPLGTWELAPPLLVTTSA